jgi:integrase
MIRRRARAAGLRDLERLGAHSLRAGFVTAALDAGVPEAAVAQQTNHRSIQTLQKYNRPAHGAGHAASRAIDL